MSLQSEDKVKFLKGMRAVREYTPQAIPDDVLNEIVDVGRWSGSSSNRQPTEVVVVRDQAVKQKMTDNGVRAGAGCAVALVILTPGEAGRGEIEAFDNGRLVERLLLAAHAFGIGANIATLKGEGPEIIRAALGIPAGMTVWTVVTMGYRDDAAYKARQRNANPGRKAVDSFAHWDRY